MRCQVLHARHRAAKRAQAHVFKNYKRLFAEYEKERSVIPKEILAECADLAGANAEELGKMGQFSKACILRVMAFYGRFG